MKKIILAILIMILAFSVNVIATEITIGSVAIDRSYDEGGGYTRINKDNPANATGKITKIEIWANNTMHNVEVAIFYVVSGNILSTRDYKVIGTVPAGSKQTFETDLDVQEGDYLGVYYSSGDLEKDIGGGYVGIWYVSGDRIPCTDVNFEFSAGRTYSLYGTGATEEEEANAIFMGCNF